MPIDDDEVLWRRVPGDRKKPYPPENPTSWKPHSDNFRGKRNAAGVSVDRAILHFPHGPDRILAMEPLADETWGVLSISAGDVRAVGHDVIPDPIDEPGFTNPAHALIVPLPNSSASGKMVKRSTWALPPAGPPI